LVTPKPNEFDKITFNFADFISIITLYFKKKGCNEFLSISVSLKDNEKDFEASQEFSLLIGY